MSGFKRVSKKRARAANVIAGGSSGDPIRSLESEVLTSKISSINVFTSCLWGLSSPYHLSTVSWSSRTVILSWHFEQALSMPKAWSNWGLGMLTVWSERAYCNLLPTILCCRYGMWQDVQRLPSEDALWNVWVSKFTAFEAWHEVHWPSSNLPASAEPLTSLYESEWGLWQSPQAMEPLR